MEKSKSGNKKLSLGLAFFLYTGFYGTFLFRSLPSDDPWKYGLLIMGFLPIMMGAFWVMYVDYWRNRK